MTFWNCALARCYKSNCLRSRRSVSPCLAFIAALCALTAQVRADEFIVDQRNEFDPAIAPTRLNLVTPLMSQSVSFTPTTNALDFVDLLNQPQDSSATLQVLILRDSTVVGASELLQFTNATTTTNHFRFYSSVPLQPGTNYAIQLQTLDNWTTALGNPALFFREGITIAAPLPPPISIHVSAVDICWSSRAGTNYQAQYRSDLTTNVWTDLGSPVSGNGVTNCVSDGVPDPKKFYRVKVLP